MLAEILASNKRPVDEVEISPKQYCHLQHDEKYRGTTIFTMTIDKRIDDTVSGPFFNVGVLWLPHEQDRSSAVNP